MQGLQKKVEGLQVGMHSLKGVKAALEALVEQRDGEFASVKVRHMTR